jgi:hypothetical protein
MDLVHEPWTTSGLGPRWTAAVRLRARRRACKSAARKLYDSPAVAVRGGGGRGRHDGALIGDWAVVKRPSDDGKAAVMKAHGVVRSEMRHGWGAFYRCRGGAGGPDGGGERPVAVERHDGGGGGSFGSGSGRGAEVARAHMRRQLQRRSVSPRRKMTGRGGLAGPAKDRGLVAVGGSGPKGEERRVG